MKKSTTLLILAILTISLFAAGAMAGKRGKKGGGEGGKLKAQAVVTIISPEDGTEFEEGSVFAVIANIECINAKCRSVTATITLPGGLSLPGGDPTHNLGNMAKGELKTTSWLVSADTAGTGYTITVESKIKGKFSTSDSVTVDVLPLGNETSM